MSKEPLWIGNTHFPHGWTTNKTIGDVLATVVKAAKRRAKLRIKLKKAGKGWQTSQAQAAYIGASLVRLDAIIRAAKRLSYEKKLEVPQYEQIAAGLKLHKPIDEAVRVYLKKKSNGGYRYFCDFGVRHRAAQALVADMINAQAQSKPFQYDTKGRGIGDAILKIRQLHAAGYTYTVRMDIKHFFDSFDHQAIIQALPISKDVTRHVVIGTHYKLQGQTLTQEEKHLQDTLHNYLTLIAERGLPQGSACSSAITNFFMSKLEPQLPKGAWFLNYVDDFLVLAQSPEKGSKAKNALTSSLKEMPVGHFELLEKSSGSFQSGVEFLGHAFAEQPDGTLKVTVSQANIHKIMAWTAEELDRIVDKFNVDQGKQWVSLDAMTAAVGLAHHILSWLRTFSHADDATEHEQELMERIETLALATGQSAAQIIALAKKTPNTDWELYAS
ncbi:reverse transcriptase domain-containing protein [Mesorhizobium sp. IMUNJ 23232]|uniref:reverse transcriptase domain-containing protein n=1 Tax=Mesorhizobium sp. IMUNJ 23232 TaxID=3376064 RepID=UPI0037A094E4